MENSRKRIAETAVQKKRKSKSGRVERVNRMPQTSANQTSANQTSANWPIALLPGLSEQDQTRLHTCGIQTTLQLLHKAQTPTQRQTLASLLQIHIQHVNKWVVLSNLSRVPAVGYKHCGLLLHAGISSPAQLAQTSLPHLHHQILKLQVAMMQRPDLCPSLDEVSCWIEQAQQLSRRVNG